MAIMKEIQIHITEYNSDGSVLVSSQALANYIIEEGFPDGLEESLKGEGYFDFQVRPFEFDVLWSRFREEQSTLFSSEPKRKSNISIYNTTNGSITNKLLEGFIDEVQLEDYDTEEAYTLTIFPNALLLKDVNIGAVTDEGEEEGDETYEFETRVGNQRLSSFSLKKILDSVLPLVNNRIEGATFSVTDESVPDTPPPTSNKRFGTAIWKEKLLSFGASLWAFFTFDTDDGDISDTINNKVYFRQSGNTVKFFRERVAWGRYVWLEKGQWFTIGKGAWVDFNLSWGVTIFGTHIGFNFGAIQVPTSSIYVPSGDSTIPWPEYRLEVHEVVSGGINRIETQKKFVGTGGFDTSNYGNKLTNNAMQNVSQTKFNQIAREQGFSFYDYNFTNKISFDLDSTNSYCMVTAKKKDGFSPVFDLYGQQVIFSYETIFDNNYMVHTQNMTLMELLKNLAKVSNRYVYIDSDNVIHLLSRGADLTEDVQYNVGEAYYDEQDIIKYKKKRHNEDEYDIDIDRLKFKSNGGIDEYGIYLRDGEFNGMVKYYQDYFQRDRAEYEITLSSNDVNKLDNTKLLQRLYITDGSGNKNYGNIIQINRSMNENKIELITELYGEL